MSETQQPNLVSIKNQITHNTDIIGCIQVTKNLLKDNLNELQELLEKFDKQINILSNKTCVIKYIIVIQKFVRKYLRNSYNIYNIYKSLNLFSLYNY